MPKVTIWIRTKDYEKWMAIKDRPQFIHNVLNNSPTVKSPKIIKEARGYYDYPPKERHQTFFKDKK